MNHGIEAVKSSIVLNAVHNLDKIIIIVISICVLLFSKNISNFLVKTIYFFTKGINLFNNKIFNYSIKDLKYFVQMLIISNVFNVPKRFDIGSLPFQDFCLLVESTFHYIAILILVILFINVSTRYLKTTITKESAITPVFAEFLKYGSKTISYIIFLFTVTKMWGFDLTGILSALGFFSLAISLSAKDTVANIFGGLSVIFDKPYVIGDTIKVGEFQGIVERITFRTTKIRTREQSVVYIPNQQTTSLPTVNQSRKQKRPLEINILISKKIEIDSIKKLMDDIRINNENLEDSVEGFTAIYIKEISDLNYVIKLICHIKSIKHFDYSSTKQKIMLEILGIIKSYSSINIEDIKIS